MRNETVPELDAQLTEVLHRRAEALDRIVDDMLIIVVDRRASLTIGVPVAQS